MSSSIPRRSWKRQQVIEVLTGLFVLKGCPAYLRSYNGSEFTATRLKQRLQDYGVTTARIEPGSPWENGYCESFNSKMRDEFIDGALFDTLQKAVILTRRFVNLCNTVRPHSAHGYRPPAPQAVLQIA